MVDKMRKFYLTDFPLNQLRIRIKDKFRIDFFETFKSEIENSPELLKVVGCNRANISDWKCGTLSMPLETIVKISNTLENCGHKELCVENLKKHLIYIKSKHGQDRYAILNPKIPLVEDWRLVRLVAHLIGDGYGGYYDMEKNCIKRTNYCNTNRQVLDKFIECLSAFGDVKFYSWHDKELFLPSSIIYILNHIYNIDFHSDKANVPTYFFNLDKNLLFHFLAAFVDDEGALRENDCRIMLANERLTRELNSLFCQVGFEVSEVKSSYEKYWYFTIRDIEKIKKLPIAHTEKLDLIKFSLGRSKEWKQKGITKNKILKFLSSRSYNAYELSRLLGISSQTVRRHMRQLLKNNKVNYTSIKGIKHWSIKEV